MKKVVWTIRSWVGVMAVLATLAFAQPLRAQQPPSAASQDGFVPVSQTAQPHETMPAPTLVAVAYGFAWVMLLGYLWSIWTRLGKVEREMQDVSRRIASGGRQV